MSNIHRSLLQGLYFSKCLRSRKRERRIHAMLPQTGAEVSSCAPANKARRFICFSGESLFADGEAVAAPRCKEGSQARQQWKNFRYNLDNTITLAGRNSLWPDEHYLIYQRVLSDAVYYICPRDGLIITSSLYHLAITEGHNICKLREAMSVL